jgi:hypothetical protein
MYGVKGWGGGRHDFDDFAVNHLLSFILGRLRYQTGLASRVYRLLGLLLEGACSRAGHHEQYSLSDFQQ